MDKAVAIGRFIFAIALVGLGLQQLVAGDFVPGPFIAPAWLPARGPWAGASALILIATGVGLAIPKWPRLAAIAMGAALLLLFAVFHLPAPGAILHDGVARTRALETLALAAGAWALSGPPLARPSRLVFALTMAVFGFQHHQYAPFVAAVVPAWIPGAMFWTYATGLAFVLAAVSIGSGKQARLAAALLGLMFLLWVLVLHLPRVLADLGNANELNSLLVALALGGAAWAMAETMPKDA